MADTRLLDHILEELQKGYTNRQIQDSLMRSGYNPQQIQQAFQAIQGQEPKQQSSSDLTGFIKQQLQQGYQLPQVQQYLLQQGYQQQQIQNAINKIYKGKTTQQRRPINLPIKPIIITLLILLFIAAITFGITTFLKNKPTTEKEGTMNYAINVDQRSIKPGETLYFSNNFINFPNKRKADISITYTVIQRLTDKVIESWQETFTKSAVLKKNMNYMISSTMKPDGYQLKAEIEYGSFSTTKSVDFNVIIETVEATCIDGKQNQGESEVDCGGPCEPCAIEQQEVVETTTVTTTPYPQSATQTDKALRNNANNALTPDVGMNFCGQISINHEMNQCMNDIAQKFEQSRICDEIQGTDEDAVQVRDTCYFNFAYTKNEFTVCEKLQNPYLVTSCTNLKKIEQIKAIQDSGDINAIGAIVGFSIE